MILPNASANSLSVNVWVKNQPYTTMSLAALASSRHTEMAPLNGDSGQRPMDRIKFCQSVAERARVIADDLISNTDWVMKFSKEAPSQVHHELQSEELSNPLNGLRTAVENLINDLQKTVSAGDNSPYLVIVFDEASSIMRKTASDEPHPGLYVALNRIISCLKRYSLWSFFLSTESLVGQLVPPGNIERTGDYLEDPSTRLILDEDKPPLKRFPPFVALQLDVEDRRKMLDQDRRAEELCKPLVDFAKLRHMALFGRPLWHIYEDPMYMNRLAKLKLLGGKQRSTFDPWDKDHVFAALSFRLSLDVCLQNPSSVSFIRTAVNSFMRVVISMDVDTGKMDTLTPSEPVLAKAAMEHLCQGGNWPYSIRTLTKELLEPGLIEKGQKGELYARLVLILAHDLVRCVTPGSVLKSAPELQPTFTVFEFLTALYGKDQVIPERIGRATMNFTHFVPAYENLTPEVIPALCHDLLRRSAAMQLAFQQQSFDLLLPIYYGKEEEEFNSSECGVILVQVKNRTEATTPKKIFNEIFTNVTSKVPPDPRIRDAPDSVRNQEEFAFKQMEKPILFLLFDLGIVRSDRATSPLVQVSVSQTKKLPELWAIHSRGHDNAVFGCLKRMDPTDDSQQFFVSMPQGESLADKLARRNRTFYELKRSYRYLGFDSEQKGKIGADDGKA
jgi:hypothetical protein